MKQGLIILLCVSLAGLLSTNAAAQSASWQVPASVAAGNSLSIPTTGSGKAVVYIVGPGEVLRREVQLGESAVFAADEIHSAGYYTAVLVGPSSTETAELDITPAAVPSQLSFLAKPSRLAVDQRNGISGVVYAFDSFDNLIVQPLQAGFALSESGGAVRNQVATSRNGVAWIRLDSAPKAGKADFQVHVGNLMATRVVQQVPGEPCNLRMSGRRMGDQVQLQTDPLRDCSGNPVPDGTIVTFKETYGNDETTVDVPLKRGVAQTSVPVRDGGVISVATGVVIGNEIRWGHGQ